MPLPINTFTYSTSKNIGDYIQSIATEQHLPRVDGHIDRDHLNKYNGDSVIVPMNGWFMRLPDNWPPSNDVVGLFVGFHVTTWNDSHEKLCQAASIEYLKRAGSIGCRDTYTRDLLAGAGVDAYFSGCPTTTFPARPNPNNGKTVIVDCDSVKIPDQVRKSAVHLTQIAPSYTSDSSRRQMAEDLLRFYRTEVSRVITTRVHCALPCAAMGIPVVFFGNPLDERLTALTEIGQKIHDIQQHSRPRDLVGRVSSRLSGGGSSDVDWSPEPLEFENKKLGLIRKLKEQLSVLQSQHSD